MRKVEKIGDYDIILRFLIEMFCEDPTSVHRCCEIMEIIINNDNNMPATIRNFFEIVFGYTNFFFTSENTCNQHPNPLDAVMLLFFFNEYEIIL